MAVDLDELTGLMLLSTVKQFGPQKFKTLSDAGVSVDDVLANPDLLPIGGKRGDQFRSAIRAIDSAEVSLARERATKQLDAAERHGAAILTYRSRAYPRVLKASTYPLPYVFVRGSLEVVDMDRSVATVGSRGIRPPYDQLQDEFARAAVRHDFVIVSGFALGADTIGHRAALEAGGATVGVMAGGVDRVFPPENRALWDEVLASGRGAVISEAPFGTRASAMTLRRRNRLIVAMSLGVLVGQSSSGGGAMNAYRFGVEQHLSVATFEPDGEADTSGNEIIATGGKSDGPVFPLKSRAEDYNEWLRRLSSTT